MMGKKKGGVMAARKTGRGFRIYATFRDQRNTLIQVHESSVLKPHCVWIFTERADGTVDFSPPHLNRFQARRLIRALEKFIEETA